MRGVAGSGQDTKFRLVIVHNDHLAVGQAALREVEKFLEIKHGKDLSAHVDNAKSGEETSMKMFVFTPPDETGILVAHVIPYAGSHDTRLGRESSWPKARCGTHFFRPLLVKGVFCALTGRAVFVFRGKNKSPTRPRRLRCPPHAAAAPLERLAARRSAAWTCRAG